MRGRRGIPLNNANLLKSYFALYNAVIIVSRVTLTV